MYWVTPQGHLQGQPRDNSNTRFFHTKKEREKSVCGYEWVEKEMCRFAEDMG